MKPEFGQIWCLKSDSSKTLKVQYVNINDIVGFSDADYRKRSYGTLKLSAFLDRFQLKEGTNQ